MGSILSAAGRSPGVTRSSVSATGSGCRVAGRSLDATGSNHGLAGSSLCAAGSCYDVTGSNRIAEGNMIAETVLFFAFFVCSLCLSRFNLLARTFRPHFYGAVSNSLPFRRACRPTLRLRSASLLHRRRETSGSRCRCSTPCAGAAAYRLS